MASEDPDEGQPGTDHQEPTLRPPASSTGELGLTILAHPYAKRVGEVLHLSREALTREGANTYWRIDRLTPTFHAPYHPSVARPLEAPDQGDRFQHFASAARGLCVAREGDGPEAHVRLWIDSSRPCRCELRPPGYHTLYATPADSKNEQIDPATSDAGEQQLCTRLSPLHAARSYSRSEIQGGVVLLFSRHVAFVLHEWRAFDAQDAALSEKFATFAGSRLSKLSHFRHLLGESAKLRDLRRRLAKSATARGHASKDRPQALAPVLLLGESGSGKMPAAQLIHLLSGRSGDWLNENMSGQPSDGSWMRTALFGRADLEQAGLADKANGGTLVFDEIANASHEAQEILLTFAEDGIVRPEGSSAAHVVDTRIVAATNKGKQAIKHDLRARFPIKIELPPLRERRDDVGRLLVALLRDGLKELDSYEIRRPDGRKSWLDLLEEPTPKGPWLNSEIVAAWAALPLYDNVRAIERLAIELLSSCVEELSCSLATESIAQLFADEATGSEGAPKSGTPPEPLTSENALRRFEKAGWKVSELVKETNLSAGQVRKLVKESGYKFLVDRIEGALEDLQVLEARWRGGENITMGVVENKLEADAQAIRGWLTRMEQDPVHGEAFEKLGSEWLAFLRDR